jgi:hypothetical protein
MECYITAYSAYNVVNMDFYTLLNTDLYPALSLEEGETQPAAGARCLVDPGAGQDPL